METCIRNSQTKNLITYYVFNCTMFMFVWKTYLRLTEKLLWLLTLYCFKNDKNHFVIFFIKSKEISILLKAENPRNKSKKFATFK